MHVGHGMDADGVLWYMGDEMVGVERRGEYNPRMILGMYSKDVFVFSLM